MRTPIRATPGAVVRWVSRLGWLRWLDAALAWGALWIVLMAVLGADLASQGAVVALGLVGLGLAIRPVRGRWRPITGWVGLTVSRRLRPGDRAWYIGAREARLVLVTARHGTRLVIARPDLAGDEGMSVRRTRVLLLPVEM